MELYRKLKKQYFNLIFKTTFKQGTVTFTLVQASITVN